MPNVSPIIRSALFVRNLELQTKFYSEVLGFNQIYYRGQLNTPAAPEIVGAPAGTIMDCCIVRGEYPNLGMVGLFQLDPLPQGSVQHSDYIAVGESVMVFYCDRLVEIVAHAVSLGAAVLCKPLSFEMPHESQLEAMIRDPEGFAINLVERDPERAWQTHLVTPNN